jgi:hypothetical protein
MTERREANDGAAQLSVTSGVSFGTVVATDLQSYHPPNLTPHVEEKTNFVPLDFAQSRIKAIEDDSVNIKSKYDERLQGMNVYYQSLLEKSKKHYESFIIEVKDKAVKQSDVFQRKFKLAVDKHNYMIQEKENLIEIRRKLLSHSTNDANSRIPLTAFIFVNGA